MAWAEVQNALFFLSVLNRSKEPWLTPSIDFVDGNFSFYHQIRYDTVQETFFVREVCFIVFIIILISFAVV